MCYFHPAWVSCLLQKLPHDPEPCPEGFAKGILGEGESVRDSIRAMVLIVQLDEKAPGFDRFQLECWQTVNIRWHACSYLTKRKTINFQVLPLHWRSCVPWHGVNSNLPWGHLGVQAVNRRKRSISKVSVRTPVRGHSGETKNKRLLKGEVVHFRTTSDALFWMLTLGSALLP